MTSTGHSTGDLCPHAIFSAERLPHLWRQPHSMKLWRSQTPRQRLEEEAGNQGRERESFT
jgi:hypothetical protein